MFCIKIEHMLHKFDPAFFNVSFFCESCPPVQVLFFFFWVLQYGRVKSLTMGQNLSVMSLCNSFISLVSLRQHMLSPQKAPERLLQLADSNLESLVVEMDQLHSRVHTIHSKSRLFSSVTLFCYHPLSFKHNIMNKEETLQQMRSEFLSHT